MASSTKAIAIHYTAEEIATGIQSVETIANRCWRKKIISNEVYKEVLRPHPSADTANKALLLVNAVEASIREEEAHFGEFLEILGNELEPQVAKELISRIGYHLEETRERTNLDQCTEDTQDKLDHAQKEAVTKTTDTPFVQVSKDSNLSADKSDSTNNASSILRNRKQGTHTCTALNGSNHSYPSETLCKHTGTHNVSESAEVEPVQATNEMPHTSGLHRNNFLQSNDVEPIQATDETTPSLLDCSLEQRQEMLQRLQEEKFAEYDKLQAKANNQILLDEKKSLKRQLEQQSIDHSHICDEKKKLEKELSDKCLKVDQLLVERSQRIASHRHNLEQLRNQVAENEKERNELEARCKDLEQRIKDITETYDSKISQYQCEIQALQEELDSIKSIVDDQSSTISEQQQEIRRLSSGVITLQDKFEKKCMDFDDYRRVTEFKSDTWAFLVFLVVFVIIIEVIFKLVFFIGLFNSLY